MQKRARKPKPAASQKAIALTLAQLEPWNPFKNCVWRGLRKPITHAEVARAIKSNRVEQSPISNTGFSTNTPTRQKHIARIAYLVLHGWHDSIQIDVGVPALNYHVQWIILDGNHRLAAAFFRKDATILAQIGGQMDHAKNLLGVAI